MAHMIDETTGRAAIAYVGQTPWHGLGQKLTAGADIETWRREAGLDYEVARAPVQFDRILFDQVAGNADDLTAIPTELTRMKGRDVLYRSDTGGALSVVSKDYKVVQPGEVLDFFAKLAEIGGFDLETAGALSDGKRIWALAKVNDGAPVIGHDVVRPYVLLATSYDGTLATTAKMTAIRVVCNNTLTMSVGGAEMGVAGFRQAKYEDDTENRAVSSLVRIPHSKNFDADKVRLELGIVSNVFERWLVEARILAERELTEAQAGNFVAKLLSPLQADGKPQSAVRDSKGYQRVMELFSSPGDLIGSDLSGTGNRWAMVNAVTQFVDHERGRTPNTRLSGAWFGTGEGIKNRAYSLLRSGDAFTDDLVAA